MIEQATETDELYDYIDEVERKLPLVQLRVEDVLKKRIQRIQQMRAQELERCEGLRRKGVAFNLRQPDPKRMELCDKFETLFKSFVGKPVRPVATWLTLSYKHNWELEVGLNLEKIYGKDVA